MKTVIVGAGNVATHIAKTLMPTCTSYLWPTRHLKG